MGLDNAYPPYGFKDENGELTGFDIDLAKEVAKRNNWSIKLEAIDWDTKDQLINSGSITCIWNGFTMDGREKNYTFSKPYMLNKQVIVVRKDSKINGLKALKDKVVETQVDSSALSVLKDDKYKKLKDSFKKLEERTDYNIAFMDLESGACDAIACDSSIADYQMTAKPDKFKVLKPELSKEHYAVAFKKGNSDIAGKVTKTLKDMYKDGTVEKIAKKYKKYGISMQNWILK